MACLSPMVLLGHFGPLVFIANRSCSRIEQMKTSVKAGKTGREKEREGPMVCMGFVFAPSLDLFVEKR